MTDNQLTGELRRFIQTIESVPQLEAILLLHNGPGEVWTEEKIAARLYLNAERAARLLVEMHRVGICAQHASGAGFSYAPPAEMRQLIEQLGHYYASHLIEVTNMIHARSDSGRKARLFADAFKFKTED